MRQKILISITAILMILCAACSSGAPDSSSEPVVAQPESVAEPESSTAEATPIQLEVSLSEDVVDGMVTVFVKTNLPDETKGMITIFNEDIGFQASDNFIIGNGEATIGPFSKQGGSLESGTYTLSFTTPLSTLQPESVQVVVGENYSNYKSEFIIDDGIGANISIDKTFVIE